MKNRLDSSFLYFNWLLITSRITFFSQDKKEDAAFEEYSALVLTEEKIEYLLNNSKKYFVRKHVESSEAWKNIVNRKQILVYRVSGVNKELIFIAPSIKYLDIIFKLHPPRPNRQRVSLLLTV